MKKLMIVLLVVFTLVGISSCDLITGLFAPAYVGVWYGEIDFTDPPIRQTLTLTADTWENVMQFQVDGTWVNTMALKGTFTYDGTTMVSTPSHMKMADASGTFPDAWTVMTAADIEMYTSTTTVATDGNTMTVTYPDTGDVAVFTRVE